MKTNEDPLEVYEYDDWDNEAPPPQSYMREHDMGWFRGPIFGRDIYEPVLPVSTLPTPDDVEETPKSERPNNGSPQQNNPPPAPDPPANRVAVETPAPVPDLARPELDSDWDQAAGQLVQRVNGYRYEKESPMDKRVPVTSSK